MHRLLNRQIKRLFGKNFEINEFDPKVQELIDLVSNIYDDFEEQRRMHEHIITVNSEELRNSNAKLKELLDERSELLEYKTNENKDIINLLHQYREAIDQTMIVSRTNRDGIITYANEKFCEISGYSKEELIGNTHKIVKNPINDPEIYKEIWNTITQKKIWHGTFANLTKNGETYYVNSTIVPLIDLDGNIKEFIGLRDDVTKQILYQEKLKHQSQRLNTIFNSQEHITIIIEPKKGVVDANSKFFETFTFENLDAFNSSNKCVCDLFQERDLLLTSDDTNRPWYENFLFGDENLNKVTHINEKGLEQIFKITAKEIELDEKQHFILTLIDITELENARRKAEIAKETKSTFLANMSHEIRTPLNAIIGFSDILTGSHLDRQEKEYSQIIAKSAQSLLDIIDDVLDISKIESGKLHIEEEAFPIHLFIENIVELFSIKAQEKKIRFIYNADPSIPYSIISDSTRIRQVLSNLLSNAIKFTNERGYVNFCIKNLKQEEQKVYLEFSIKDNGIGISKEQKEVIFQPFLQADSGINRKFGGTGLGLSICKDIVQLLGSEIILESELGQGSTFKFILEVAIDKKVDDNSHHFSHLEFALTNSSENKENLKTNITNYLNKIGDVYEFDEATLHNNIDFLFCFQNDDLLRTLQKFTMLNEKAKVVFVGDKKAITQSQTHEFIDYYIDLPIYGSKIFNIISDNTEVVETIEEEPIIQEVAENKSTQEEATKHILVAEDNPNNQKLIEVLIQKEGYKCTIAYNGQEAVDLYSDNYYDLIFMDINMPVMDGVTATKEILQLQKTGGYKVPIIALTANSIEGDRERYLYAGMDDYMAKPIMLDKLRAMIQKYTNVSYKEQSQTPEKKEVAINYSKQDAMNALGLDETTIDMLLDNFFLTIYDDCDKLATAIKEKSFESILSQAHYIKGSCLNLAISPVAQKLEEIEKKAEQNQCDTQDIQEIVILLKHIQSRL